MSTQAVIVTHADLAEALLATARSVYGEFDGCHAVSNQSKSPEALSRELDAIVSGRGNYLMMVDYFGGSTCHACLSIARNHSNVRLVSGVNLPMLLAFLYRRDEVTFEELPRELTERGHGSIRIVDPENL